MTFLLLLTITLTLQNKVFVKRRCRSVNNIIAR